jgi:fatty-acyl-CoA synthase
MGGVWATIGGAVSSNCRLHQPKKRLPPTPLEQILYDAERTAAQIIGECGNGHAQLRVGLLMANGEPWLRGLLAALRIGAVAVPLPLPILSTRIDGYAAQLRRIHLSASLDAFLVDQSVRRITSQLARHLPEANLIDITEPATGPLPAELPAEPGEDDLAIIQYTSGSTAAPKGVALTHANVLAGHRTISHAIGWTADDALGHWLPLFHDMGLFSLLSALMAGVSGCLWRPSDFVRNPRSWLVELADSPTTISPAPNFAYDYLVRAVDTDVPEGLDLSRWRMAFNGAEPVRQRTLERFDAAFGRHGWRAEAMTPCYGLAEATLLVTAASDYSRTRSLLIDRFSSAPGNPVRVLADADASTRQVVSVGTPGHGLGVRIADGDAALDDMVVGEVQVTGAPVMRGYLGVAAEEQPFAADGWLRTGDLGFLQDGELFVVGRIKDTIVVRGQNFYAEDIEELAGRSAGRAASRCAALSDDHDDAESVVIIIETALTAAEADALADRVRADVAAQLALDKVRVLTVAPRSIPVTTSGKIRRRETRSRYAEHLVEPAGSASPSSGGPA